MSKQLIRLTEDDLHRIIESTVQRVIMENSEDEGFLDTMKSFVGQYGRRGANKAKEMGQAAGKAMKNGYDTASQKVQSMGQAAGKAMKNGYDTASQKVQSMGQAAGKAMKNGYDTASQKVQSMGQDVKDTWKGAQRDSSMKDMQKAFNNFKMAVEKFQQNGGKLNKQLASRISGIENMINSYQPNF